MPNIPLIEQQTRTPSTTNRAQATGDTFGAGIGKALGQAGDVLAKAGAQLAEKREKDDKLKAEKFLAEFHQEELKRFSEERDNTDDPRGFSDRFTQSQNARYNAAFAQQGFSENVGKYTNLRYAETVQTSTLRNSLNYEHTASAEQTKQLWEDITNDKAKVARADPNALPELLSSIEILADQQGLTGTVREKYTDFYQTAITMSAAMGRIDQADTIPGAVALQEEIKDEDSIWFKQLDVDQYQKLLNLSDANIRDARVEKNRIETEHRRQASISMSQEFTDLYMRDQRGELKQTDTMAFRDRWWNQQGGSEYVRRLDALFFKKDASGSAAMPKEQKVNMGKDLRSIETRIREGFDVTEDIDLFEQQYGEFTQGLTALRSLDKQWFDANAEGKTEDPDVQSEYAIREQIRFTMPNTPDAYREAEQQIEDWTEKYGHLPGASARRENMFSLLQNRMGAAKKETADYNNLFVASETDPQAYPLDPGNPDHVAAVNTYWDQTVAPILQSLPDDMPTDERADIINAQVGQVVGKFGGIMPESVKSTIRSSLASSDPNMKANGALMIRAIQASAPQAMRQMEGQKYIKDGLYIAEKLDQGLTPKQAVDTWTELQQISAGDKKALGDLFDKEVVKDPLDWEQVQEDVLGRKDILGIFDTDKPLPADAKADFMRLYREQFTLTKDQTTAYNVAGKMLTQKWSVSHVNNSDGEWSREAPERHYGVPSKANNTEWIINQAKEDIIANSLFSEDSDFPDLVRDGTLRIIPVPNKTLGGKPVYKLSLLTDQGYMDLGMPDWSPDYRETDEFKRQQEEAAQWRARQAREGFDVERETRLRPARKMQ